MSAVASCIEQSATAAKRSGSGGAAERLRCGCVARPAPARGSCRGCSPPSGGSGGVLAAPCGCPCRVPSPPSGGLGGALAAPFGGSCGGCAPPPGGCCCGGGARPLGLAQNPEITMLNRGARGRTAAAKVARGRRRRAGGLSAIWARRRAWRRGAPLVT